MFTEGIHEIVDIFDSFRNITEVYVEEAALIPNPVSGGLEIDLTHVWAIM